MVSLLKKLHDPLLVVSFQRKCGVLPKPKSSWRDSGDGDTPGPGPGSTASSVDILTKKFVNAQTDTSVTDLKERHLSSRNGFTKSEDVLTSDNTNSGSDDDTEDYDIQNKFLYNLFHFAANFGNEIFYITFFPFWFWNVDGYVGRRVLVFWGLFMYLGQATKDILKIPRPRSPPVIQLEKLYALEYGMPSTHAMVGAGIPFGMLILTYGRYNASC